MPLPPNMRKRAEDARAAARQSSEPGELPAAELDNQTTNEDSSQAIDTQGEQDPSVKPEVSDSQPQVEREPPAEKATQNDGDYAALKLQFDELNTRFNHLRQNRGEKLEATELRASELENQVNQLIRENDTLRNQVPEPQEESYVDDETRQVIGDEESDALNGVARKLMAEIADLKAQLAGQGSADKPTRESMYDELDATVSGWRTTNNDPRFIAWLDRLDPDTGVPPRTSFNYHVTRNDAVKVGGMFKAYTEGRTPPAKAAPGTTETGHEGQAERQRVSSPNLEGNRSPSQGVESGPKTYRMSTVTAFYEKRAQDRRNGVFKTNPKAKEASDALDLEYRTATIQGRVTNG